MRFKVAEVLVFPFRRGRTNLAVVVSFVASSGIHRPGHKRAYEGFPDSGHSSPKWGIPIPRHADTM